MKRGGVLLGIVLGLALFTGGGLLPQPPVAVHAEESWRQELEELCSRTNDAIAFTAEELRTFVEKCDRLKPRIEALDESSRKVYGKRLRMCRDFYQFMAESKKEGGAK
jgi:hypothetical protein